MFAALAGMQCQSPDTPVDFDALPLIDRLPHINPVYCGIKIPPSIAPLNFLIAEKGRRYYIRAKSLQGRPITITVSAGGRVVFPEAAWHTLLQANRGNPLSIDVATKGTDGQWRRFSTITDTIAGEDIDPYLVYRRTNVIYSFMKTTGIYERDIRSFTVRPVVRGLAFRQPGSISKGGCVNCHSFQANSPDRMAIDIRDYYYGKNTFIVDHGKTDCVPIAMGFIAWQPHGTMMVYSANRFRQFFRSVGEVCEVVDLQSTLRTFSADTRETSEISAINRSDSLITHPAWSPDGRTLYYCRAPRLWNDSARFPPPGYDRVRYDLVRQSYDNETGTWGTPEIVVSAEKTGMSILFPRVSPDGRFVLVCMVDHGCFPIYSPESDLYVIDLETMQGPHSASYSKLACNSNQSESWHCWSSNGRWIAFSSNRLGGNLTRTFLSAIDRNGRTSAPFVIPRKDPRFYESFTEVFSVPELITAPVTVPERTFARKLKNRPVVQETEQAVH